MLLVTPFLPHAKVVHAGGRFVRWLLEEIGRNADLCLLSRVSPDEAPFADEVREHCRAARFLPHAVPTGGGSLVEKARSYVSLGRSAGAWMREERFDVVQVEHVEAGIGIRIPRGMPAVIDCHDVLTKPRERIFHSSRGVPRISAGAAYLATEYLERRILGKFSMAFVRSSVDGEYLRRLVPGIPVRIVAHPCGLDLTGKERAHDGATVLFLGAMHRSLNVDAVLYFAREVFPRVLAKVPAARFVVAGANPPEIVTGLSSRNDRIRVVGRVEDLEACYLSATVFVAPILVGGGIIVKILDAMAAGVPVVTTPYGNEGIGAIPGRDVMIAENAKDFADAVVRMLSDPRENAQIGHVGREYVRKRFGREVLWRELRTCYEELVTGRTSGTFPAGASAKNVEGGHGEQEA